MRWLVPCLVIFALCAGPVSGALAEQDSGAASPAGADPAARIAEMKALVDANPRDPKAHYQLGNAFYDSNKLGDAILSYQRAVGLDSTYKEALVNLGNALNETGRLDDAVETFETALRHDPNDDKALSNLGNSYYALGRYGDAMDTYHRALAVNPDCYQARYNMGVAFADAGIFREAVREWIKVMELAPGTPDADSARENVRVIEKILNEKYLNEKKPPEAGTEPAPGGKAGEGGR
jgi:tetratricopeptide (TPR) repeat protein